MSTAGLHLEDSRMCPNQGISEYIMLNIYGNTDGCFRVICAAGVVFINSTSVYKNTVEHTQVLIQGIPELSEQLYAGVIFLKKIRKDVELSRRIKAVQMFGPEQQFQFATRAIDDTWYI